jgi:creatinine amidohydrolase/Fe(II)-dependent formamide hydrolase-like protein
MKVGVMGEPERANAEAGRRMVEEAVTGMSEYIGELNRRLRKD